MDEVAFSAQTVHRNSKRTKIWSNPMNLIDSGSSFSSGMIMETNIQALPVDVLEYIINLLSPYDDLKHCMLVCKEWHRLGQDVIRRKQNSFTRCIRSMSAVWNVENHVPGPTIALRYAHCSCIHGNSLFVFGGRTAMNTAFNDLWRYELNSRRWIRPLVGGSYPTPKSFSTFVAYKDLLILFGGCAHPSPSSVHQSLLLFSQLHIYHVLNNNWLQIYTTTKPPATAGHSATVHGNLMVVFGGAQMLQEFNNSSNDVWVFNLINYNWFKQETSEPKPGPRFGQTQVRIDDDHLLIIGGCSRPNMRLSYFSDVWLLTLNATQISPWIWKKLTVRNAEHAASQLFGHSGCKVGDTVVFLGRSPSIKGQLLPLMTGGPLVRSSYAPVWVPPKEDAAVWDLPMDAAMDRNTQPRNPAVTLRSSNVAPTKTSPQATNHDGHCHHSANCDEASSSTQPMCHCSTADSKVECKENSTGAVNSNGAAAPSGPNSRPVLVTRNSAMPSIRPNSMLNRQRQMEGIQRMEERLRNALKPNVDGNDHPPCNPPGRPRAPTKNVVLSARNPMSLYVLDISQAINSGEVEWLPVRSQAFADSPEETIHYTLNYGRGELVMFGGVQNDNACQEGMGVIGSVVSNQVHILSCKPLVF